MTEKEAIKEIIKLCCNEPQFDIKGRRKCRDGCMYGTNYCAFKIAISALEEIQQYREIGTVEECRGIKKRDTELTPELYYDTWICPNCKEEYELDYEDYKFCPECGQRINWEEEDEE